ADGIDAMRETFFDGGRRNGYPEDGLEEVWEVLDGYKGYGFCQGHAEAFADHANATAYLATHYPAELLAATMDNQPAGHWACDVLVGEARRLGIRVYPLDVNLSEEHFKSRPMKIRVGWRAVRGLTEATLERIVLERQLDPFADVPDFVRRVRPRRDELYKIAQAGAFDAMCPRRPLMWAISEGSIERFDESSQTDLGLAAFRLPDIEEFTDIERFRLEVGALGFSVRWHPLDFYRDELRESGVVTAEEAKNRSSGSRVKVAGVMVAKRQPPTLSGRRVVFLTLFDETGLLNVTVWDRVYRQYGGVVYRDEGPMIVEGIVTRRHGLGVIAERLETIAGGDGVGRVAPHAFRYG
ncbi:MAG: hypothetical protein O3A46_14730, partial [Candidatus Poribacteria bacterium]|nr:hypothetical protein [Candidatus Poribacteria bacterium]